MTAPLDAYSVASGMTIYGGRAAPGGGGEVDPPPPPPPGDSFDSIAVASDDGLGTASGAAPHIVVLDLHGSNGSSMTTGKQYRAQCSGLLAMEGHTEFAYSLARSTIPRILLVRPVDKYDRYPNNNLRESMWLGFKGNRTPTDRVHLTTKRRLDTLMAWVDANLTTGYERTKTCITGRSMGAWGSMTFGLRNPARFAAIYADMPRVKHDNTVGNVAVANYTASLQSVPVASAPLLADEDGGTSVAAYMDSIAYVSNTANDIPWLGFVIGRNDGFAPFPDLVNFVAALRAAKRGFCFLWNDGGHTTGPSLNLIRASYPYGTFEIGKGYPLFTNHSGDADPAVDLVGSINEGLSFRNVVETAGGWSCEVTSTLGARTVNVEPKSKVFTAAVAAQLVTIPAANTWVPVSFTA